MSAKTESVLNVHFSAILVSSEASRRAELEGSWQRGAEDLRSRLACEAARISLTRQLSSTSLLWSSSGPVTAGSGGVSAVGGGGAVSGSQGLLNRLERVASARSQKAIIVSPGIVGGTMSSPSTNDDDLELFRRAMELTTCSRSGCNEGLSDAAAAVAKRKKFNKVHSMRMMVSGTQDQQAARQVFEAEKQLQRFMSSTGSFASPKLPK
jgi:hypothetical protein